MPRFYSHFFVGGATAIFAGQNVHKRLVTEETYHRKEYEAAMKRSFIGTDEDLLAGPVFIFSLNSRPSERFCRHFSCS